MGAEDGEIGCRGCRVELLVACCALDLLVVAVRCWLGSGTMLPAPAHPQLAPARQPTNSLPLAAALLQAGAGLVADSVPESEYEETVNKAAALGRAIDLAEQAFVAAEGGSGGQ